MGKDDAPPPATAAQRIIYAGYGGEDVTEKVRSKVGDGTEPVKLEIAAQGYNGEFGDPIPGTVKPFILAAGEPNDDKPKCKVYLFYEDQACEVEISKEMPTKQTERGERPKAKEIVSASYSGADVTAQIKEIWNRDGSLRVERFTTKFPNNHPNIKKPLVIYYKNSKQSNKLLAAFYVDGESCAMVPE